MKFYPLIFENSHSERREIDVVQVTHFARKEVVAFRLLDAHSDVGVRNIDRTVNALAVRFPLEAEIFVIQYAFCVHTIGERAAAAADAVQLLNQSGKFGRFAFVDIADVRAEFVIPVRFVSLRRRIPNRNTRMGCPACNTESYTWRRACAYRRAPYRRG